MALPKNKKQQSFAMTSDKEALKSFAVIDAT